MKTGGDSVMTARISQRIKVRLETQGCKLNQAETESLALRFAAAGYEVVSAGSEADVCILNSCTVTQVADAKARRWLRAARRRHPEALLVATGCYAELSPEILAETTPADIIVGNIGKPNLVSLVTSKLAQHPDTTPITERPGGSGRTRSFVKIQDGCRSGCAYCLVPFARPVENSQPADAVIGDIRHRQELGYREVVLTGTKVGTYDAGALKLGSLLRRILEETDIPRLRLSSLQPQEISPALLDAWDNPRLCRHFHLSLQSGSDSVLRRMRRRYDTAAYRQALALIRERLPRAAVTTDIITGFPGESEAEFAESYDFCRETGFARIHVFPYSPRAGTAAAIMTDQVPATVKKQRSRRMLKLAAEASLDFRRRLLGETLTVLGESRRDGCGTGLTDNYVKLYFRSEGNPVNRILAVKLKEIYRNGIWGEVTES